MVGIVPGCFFLFNSQRVQTNWQDFPHSGKRTIFREEKTQFGKLKSKGILCPDLSGYFDSQGGIYIHFISRWELLVQ